MTSSILIVRLAREGEEFETTNPPLPTLEIYPDPDPMHRLLSVVFKTYRPPCSNHHSNTSSCAITPSTFSPSSTSERSDECNEEGFDFHLDQNPPEIPDPIDGHHINSAELATLVAKYGHAPATAWLERTRYRIWRPSDPVPQSSFLPVQGYLQTSAWVFAWGSPLVSDKAALKPVLTQFIAWVRSHDLHLVYCCVPDEIEQLLGNMGWSTVSCICEDVIDPRHILDMTREDDEGGHGSMVKDLKKNPRRAERADVQIKRILQQDWSDDLRREIDSGVAAWKQARKGLQLAAMSFDPWLNFENREYWVAFQHQRVVGILILTQAGDSYVVKHAAQFPDAPKGTSERLIHTVLRDLQEQHPDGPMGPKSGHLTVTFNISAASDLKPTRNISGWKFTWLNQTYTQVARGAHLLNRHDFRRKFDTFAQRMFVCYPTEDGFGLDGIEKLLKLLRR